jgi:hypothetical protein
MENTLTASLMSALEIEEIPGQDLFVVAKYLVPTDAFVAQGCLRAAGVPAVVADNHHVQAYELLSPALGGVRILVPESYIAQSKEVLAALERGDFALDDDADVGASTP